MACRVVSCRIIAGTRASATSYDGGSSRLRRRRLLRRSDAVACMCAATLEGPRTPGRPPTGHGERGRVRGSWNTKWGSRSKERQRRSDTCHGRECRKCEEDGKRRTESGGRAPGRLSWWGNDRRRWGTKPPIAKERGSRGTPPGEERRVLWSRARARLFTSRVPATNPLQRYHGTEGEEVSLHLHMRENRPIGGPRCLLYPYILRRARRLRRTTKSR